MTKEIKPEYERISILEGQIPALASEFGHLRSEVDEIRTELAQAAAQRFGGDLTAAGANRFLLPGLASPMGTLFCDPLISFLAAASFGFEAAGVSAGTAVHDTKDAIDKAARTLANARDRKNTNPRERQGELTAAEKSLREVLEAGRKAKNAVAGAATAAKKHKAAREGLKKARKSFNEAEDKLDVAKQKITKSTTASGAKNKHDRLDEAKTALVDAKNKINEALDHLQDALDAIES